MGAIKKKLVKNNEKVRGVIIANVIDKNLELAVSVSNDIDMYVYSMYFNMERFKNE